MLLHPEDLAGTGQAQAYLDGLSTTDGALATWDAFLQAASRETAASMRKKWPATQPGRQGVAHHAPASGAARDHA